MTQADLSRLGRHRTQTALFIDYLREHSVRVLSATENIDTFNENDDLIIGFKGLVNDFYARDGSRRVRTGYRQKQKEGIVMIHPSAISKIKIPSRWSSWRKRLRRCVSSTLYTYPVTASRPLPDS